jgi:carbonic anhydrase/acetyltransferase-like protein (isoleucine patch superfamily)
MSLLHQGMSSRIAPTAYVARNAVVCGDATYHPRCLL